MTARREISRQEFLKISGRAAAGAAAGSTLLLATDSATLAQGSETVLITDFGAVGNGVHDDTAAFVAAMNEAYRSGGGRVLVPATGAFYKITRAIDLKSDLLHPVHIVGEGNKSFIKNVRTGGHEGVVFRPGKLVAGGKNNPFAGPGQTWHAIEDAERGADRVFPKAPAGTFRRGDMIFVASEERATPGGERSEMWWPLKPHIAIVLGVGERGGLLLSDPLRYNYRNAEVAKFPHGCSHGSVRNLRLEYVTPGFNAFAGGGNSHMTFRNINVTKGFGVFGGNGYSNALVENIRGRPYAKGIEFAYMSHDTTVRNVDIEPAPQPVTKIRTLFYLAQGCHHFKVEDVRVDHKDRLPEQLGTVFGHGGIMPGCSDNVLRRYHSYSSRFALGLNISGPADKPVSNNRLVDSVVIAKGAHYALRISSGGGGGHRIRYNRLEAGGTSVVLSSGTNNTLVANNVVPRGVKDSGQNNTVQNNTVTDTPSTGPR
jgi:hypothetical protein